MALRIEAATRACVIAAVFAFGARAQTHTYAVRHRHLHGGAEGTLRVTETSVSFDETRKKNRCSRTWNYDDIQKLELSADTLRITTYEDRAREFGRDRVWLFDKLPPDLSRELYPAWSKRLDQRFVAALADDHIKPDWRIPAKLMHGLSGYQGELLFAHDLVVFKTPAPQQSRTWRITDIGNAASADPFDLTINTREGDYRFQLKEALPESAYRALWRQVNLTRGLQILSQSASSSGEPK